MTNWELVKRHIKDNAQEDKDEQTKEAILDALKSGKPHTFAYILKQVRKNDRAAFSDETYRVLISLVGDKVQELSKCSMSI
jgi:hypothetical protein